MQRKPITNLNEKEVSPKPVLLRELSDFFYFNLKGEFV